MSTPTIHPATARTWHRIDRRHDRHGHGAPANDELPDDPYWRRLALALERQEG